MSTNLKQQKSLTIYDISDTTFQRMILFLVYDEPSEMLKLRALSKHFYNILDIKYGGTNYIWKRICHNKFKTISSNLQTKRWDKLYQLRIMAMKRDLQHYSTTYSNVNKIQDIEDISIEGCQFALPISHTLEFKDDEKNGQESIYNALKQFTFDEIKIKNSLYENGLVWFIKCPILSETQPQRNHFVEKQIKSKLLKKKIKIIEDKIDEEEPNLSPEIKNRKKKLLLLQSDLFIMTVTTVFRNLEEERIWEINDAVRERFNAESLYKIVLQEDLPWRQWNEFVRNKIVTYLRENNMVNVNGMQQYPTQPLYHQQHEVQQYPATYQHNPNPPQVMNNMGNNMGRPPPLIQPPMWGGSKMLNNNIRFCNVCKKHIYLVKTEEEMKEYLDNGSCVSLSGKLKLSLGNEDGGCVVM